MRCRRRVGGPAGRWTLRRPRGTHSGLFDEAGRARLCNSAIDCVASDGAIVVVYTAVSHTHEKFGNSYSFYLPRRMSSRVPVILE